MRRFGNSYGGYYLPENCLTRNSNVYSIGLGEDASFDIDLFLSFGCNIHIFDPTPKSIMYYAKNLSKHQFLQFSPVGIWKSDGYQRFYYPRDETHVSCSIDNIQHTDAYFVGHVKRLSTMMHELGHSSVDLLKLDIEGAELDVLDDVISSGIYPSIICVECHLNVDPGDISHILFRVGYQLIYNDHNNLTFQL